MVKVTSLLALAGVILLGCMLQSEYVVAPMAFDWVGRLVYRAVFFIVLPFRILVTVFIPRVGHHWPVANVIVACLGTPFFFWGLWRLLRQLVLLHKAWGRRGFRQAGGQGPLLGRRRFLVRSAAGVVGVATGGLGCYAALVAPERVRIRRYEIPVKGLPPAMDGFRLVHVSDTHYGPCVALSYLGRAVGLVNQLEGDLVVLTGDYVHRTPRAIDAGIELFARLRSRLGAVAVLGNHDHWEGAELCRAAFRRIDLPLIDNRPVYVSPEGLTESPQPGRSICVAGVGDLWEDEVSFDRALDAVPAEIPRIVLSHNPDVAELVDCGRRVDLMLSGHTHGGQVNLPRFGALMVPSRYGGKYVGGLCYGPQCPIVISRGVGLAVLPVRFRVPPELGVIVLRKG